jgi:hypothetical protein
VRLVLIVMMMMMMMSSHRQKNRWMADTTNRSVTCDDDGAGDIDDGAGDIDDGAGDIDSNIDCVGDLGSE